MLEVPIAVAGALTVVALVGGGIFLYPWLLARRGGALAVAVVTAVLALLFFRFDRGSGSPIVSAAFALLWAAAPAAVGLLVFRLQRR